MPWIGHVEGASRSDYLEMAPIGEAEAAIEMRQSPGIEFHGGDKGDIHPCRSEHLARRHCAGFPGEGRVALRH